MKIGFAPVSTVEVKHVSLLSEMEQKLNNFFQSKHYGEDLKELCIRIIAVSPSLERFFKQQDAQYLNKKNKAGSRALKYCINLNFERFNNANEAEAKEMIKTEVLKSLSLFDRFKNKIKDFNVTPFRQDMRYFFEQATAH